MLAQKNTSVYVLYKITQKCDMHKLELKLILQCHLLFMHNKWLMN